MKHAEHLARRKEVWEAMRETAGKTCSTSLSDGRDAGPQHDQGFATETSESTGKTKQSINRSIRRATAVCQQARDLCGVQR